MVGQEVRWWRISEKQDTGRVGTKKGWMAPVPGEELHMNINLDIEKHIAAAKAVLNVQFPFLIQKQVSHAKSPRPI